jgi:hypothetical protein
MLLASVMRRGPLWRRQRQYLDGAERPYLLLANPIIA